MRVELFVLGLVVACHSHASNPPPIGDAAARACPQDLDLELLASDSRFSPGWKGLAHGVGLATGSRFSVAIAQCDSECRRCSFHGPVRNPTDPVISQRCELEPSQICAADTDCPAAVGPCRFVLPPIASAVAGFPTCSLAIFEPVAGAPDPDPVLGTIDLVTGEMDFARLNLLIQVNASVSTGCIACTNDIAPYDGHADGTCAGTTTPCDIHGAGTVFTSLDCPMGSSLGIAIPLPGNDTSTASRSWTMDATRPKCTATNETTKSCWCGMCSDGTPCTDSRQCGSAGPCGAATGPGSASYQIANNSCGSASTCGWDPTMQHGVCSGTTTSCFPDTGTMTAIGSAEVHDGFYIDQVANLICLPSFGNAGVDGAAGFPGPLLFAARFRVVTR